VKTGITADPVRGWLGPSAAEPLNGCNGCIQYTSFDSKLLAVVTSSSQLVSRGMMRSWRTKPLGSGAMTMT